MLIQLKKKIKEYIKLIIISFLKSLPKVIQIYPCEIFRINFIQINNVKIFFEPSNELSKRRWDAFQKTGKEENTINWINNFDENKVFFDIGANIGVFSIYASLKKKNQVFSFEPEPNSFIELFRTIKLNRSNITPMLIPLNDENSLNFFNLKNIFVPGKSGHYFGDKDDKKENFGISGCKLDELILQKKIPFPNYIKIDVDGLENKVLSGMNTILENEKLKSILIEFAKVEEKNFYVEKLHKYGFKLIQGPTGNNRNYIFQK